MEIIQGSLLHRMDHDAAPTSSWTDEDKDVDTHVSSPVVMSMGGGGGQRRHTQSWQRVWTPLPHFAGLGHSINPIPYPPQLNFPLPPIITPNHLEVPPPLYPMLPPPVTAPAAPAPVVTHAATPPAWADMMNVPVPAALPVGGPMASPQVPVVAT